MSQPAALPTQDTQERSPWLSRAEIRAMTRTPLRAAQVAFMVRNGIRHYVDAHGWPVVLRSVVEGDGPAARQVAPKWAPRKAANG